MGIVACQLLYSPDMSNFPAYKIDFEPLMAFPRVVYTPPTPPAFIVEDHEVARLAFDLPECKALPVTALIDNQGRVHFEINHTSFYPLRTLKGKLQMALRPNKYFYNLLRTKIIEGSLIAKERRLIGGAVFVFNYEQKEVEVKLLGILPHKDLSDVDPEIRKQALGRLIEESRPMIRWLGAKKIFTSPCVIPVEKMAKHGYRLVSLNIKERWKKFKEGFPMSLLKRLRIFSDEKYSLFLKESNLRLVRNRY